MNFPVAMLVFSISFLCLALGFYKIMEFFGVRKFTNKEEESNPKLQ